MASDTGTRRANVLETPPPCFSSHEVETIAAELYGVAGTAVDLGSERDQTWLIDDGARGGVVKISNLGEDPAILDLELEAILHIARVDPELPVAQPLQAGGAYRTTVDGPGGTHFVRMFERLEGNRARGVD